MSSGTPEQIEFVCFLKPHVVLKPCLFEKALYTDIIFRKTENRESELLQMGKATLKKTHTVLHQGSK